MKNKGVEFKIEEDKVKIFLYGRVRKRSIWDMDDEPDFISSEAVKEILNRTADDKVIEVHINSGGGDVFESLAIHNMLKQVKNKVVVYIDSLAGSGASIIAMAGDKVYMPKTAMLMIHKAQTIAIGNAETLQKVAEDLTKIDSVVASSYKVRFVGTNEELDKLLSAETWLTAEKAKVFGFIDEILDEIKDDEAVRTAQKNGEEIVNNLFAKFIASADEKKVQNASTDDKYLFSNFK